MNASTTLRETISHNSLSYLVYQDHIDVSLSRSNPQYSRMAAMGLKLRDKIAEKITELRTFSSCDVADALVKLGLKRGNYLRGISRISPVPPFPLRIRPRSHWKICGEVVTVKMDTWGNKPSVSNPFRPQKDFVEYNKPGKIMVIQASANKAREYAAAWSGLMVARAKELGAQGVIVDGHVREVVEMRRLNFPVFARGVAAVGAEELMRVNKIDVSLEIGGVSVATTDLILADDHGVVSVTNTRVDRVLQLCREAAEKKKEYYKTMPQPDESDFEDVVAEQDFPDDPHAF